MGTGPAGSAYSQGDLEKLHQKNLACMPYDLDILSSIRRGGQYYIFAPRKFLLKKFARYASTFAFIALVSYPLVAAALAIWTLVALYKFHIFTGYLAALNISRKKVWAIMLVWIFLVEIAGVFFRGWLDSIGIF